MSSSGKEQTIQINSRWCSGKESTCQCSRHKTQVQSLGQEDLLEEEMATHSSTLAWKTPLAAEPGGLQSIGSPRVGHNWAHTHTIKQTNKRTHCHMREENFLLIHLLFNCLKFTARNKRNTKTFERTLPAILNKKAKRWMYSPFLHKDKIIHQKLH